MKSPSVRRYAKWHARLLHLQARKHGIPEETLAWTAEYFGKSADVQRYLGLQSALKPETETALRVMERLTLAGVRVKNKRGED
jgi:hypothetical protein